MPCNLPVQTKLPNRVTRKPSTMYSPVFWVFALQSFCRTAPAGEANPLWWSDQQETIPVAMAAVVSVAIMLNILLAVRSALGQLQRRGDRHVGKLLMLQVLLVVMVLIGLFAFAFFAGHFGFQMQPSQILFLLGRWTIELAVALFVLVNTWALVRFTSNHKLKCAACIANLAFALNTAIGWSSLIYLERWCLA